MYRAIELARRARGTSSPNPPVGAVLVRDGLIIGEGWTQAPGEHHAEIIALRMAGSRASGSTLYVTLEPCSHWGRTPPCVDTIIGAHVSEVHTAVRDPNPRVHGQGIARLREHGIDVVVGELAAEAEALIEAHAVYIGEQRPHVTLLLGVHPEAVPDIARFADMNLDIRPHGPPKAIRRGGGTIDFSTHDDPVALVRDLASQEITSVLLVGDGEIASAWLQAGIVDRIIGELGSNIPEGFSQVDMPGSHGVFERKRFPPI